MKLLQLTLSALLVAVVSAQQSHPQLQAYLAQQQQLQQQQQQLQQQQVLQQQPARQQYRLLQQPQVQQQYSSDDDNSASQYQQLPQLSPALYRAQAAAAQPQQQLSPAAIARLRAVQAAQQSQGGSPLENPEDYDPNPQYQFGFDVKDDQYTNYQNRKEQRDGDKISGSYSVVDSDGFIRTVTYTADPKEGFKAEVTRTPTDIVVKLPTPPPQQLTEAAGLQRQLAARQQQYEQPQAQPVQYTRPQYSVAPQHAAAASPQQLQHLLAAQQRPLLRAAAASPSAAYQTYQQQ